MIDRTVGDLVGWLWSTSWQVSVLVLLVLLCERCFDRRLTPRWRYVLWSLVVLRLLAPIQPSVPAGLWSPARPWFVSGVEAPPVDTVGLGSARGLVLRPRDPDPRTVASAAADPVPRESAPRALPVALRSSEESRDAMQRTGFPWLTLLFLIWCSGALLLALRALVAELRFRRRTRDARPVEDPRLLAVLTECRALLRLARPVELLETSAVGSPAVHRLRRPRLLLPPGVGRSFGETELRLLFLHELTHVKRRDVESNLLVLAASCLFWFHPLVHFAVARLLGAREALRDWEALAALPGSSPRLYANTLIKLLERSAAPRPPDVAVAFAGPHGSIHRRILMITRFDATGRRGRFLGLALLFPLAWVAFTSAAPHLDVSAAILEQDLLRIPVQGRAQELPEWRRTIAAKLAEPVTLEVEEASLVEVVESLREACGLNIVVARGLAEEVDDVFSVDFHDVPLERALRMLARMADNGMWMAPAGEALYLDYAENLPQLFETRIYDVAQLLSLGDDRESSMDLLIELVTTIGTRASWDESPYSRIEPWNELLIVAQTPEAHDEVHAFLERLLNRGRVPDTAQEPWRIELEEKLRQRVDVSFEGEALRGAADLLQGLLGVFVHVPEDYEEEAVSLVLRNVRVDTILAWVTQQTGLAYRLEEGSILFGEQASTVLEMYEVGDLLAYGDRDYSADVLASLLIENVDSRSWDEIPNASIRFWNDLLLVQQTLEAQAGVRAFLADLGRAIR